MERLTWMIDRVMHIGHREPMPLQARIHPWDVARKALSVHGHRKLRRYCTTESYLQTCQRASELTKIYLIVGRRDKATRPLFGTFLFLRLRVTE